MGNGIGGLFDRSNRHIGMPDHARMIALGSVGNLRLRTGGKFHLNVGWYDFVGVAYSGS